MQGQSNTSVKLYQQGEKAWAYYVIPSELCCRWLGFFMVEEDGMVEWNGDAILLRAALLINSLFRASKTRDTYAYHLASAYHLYLHPAAYCMEMPSYDARSPSYPTFLPRLYSGVSLSDPLECIIVSCPVL